MFRFVPTVLDTEGDIGFSDKFSDLISRSRTFRSWSRLRFLYKGVSCLSQSWEFVYALHVTFQLHHWNLAYWTASETFDEI